ncbi:MAG: hypothetical protein B6245_06965 [Desulfobacteraceae bacterium 4572_88]|nr:MAG: hypothetical protein B6245_06965 [Desulfobacteraceae bacterium 4572_88]
MLFRTQASAASRPIVLTSLTTFLGLTPMIFESSLQARFLIPMAISLGFGVLFCHGHYSFDGSGILCYYPGHQRNFFGNSQRHGKNFPKTAPNPEKMFLQALAKN